MRRGSRATGPVHVLVPVYGPEPIGANQQDALDATIGLRLGGTTGLRAEGLRGQDDASTSLYASPQQFTAVGALVDPIVAPGEPTVTDNDDNPLPPSW